MKNIFGLIIILACVFPVVTKAQSQLRGDVPLSYISDDQQDIDISFSYKITRILSLKAKANQPLALPLEKVRDRKNLGLVIMEGVFDSIDALTVFKPFNKEMEVIDDKILPLSQVAAQFDIKSKFDAKFTQIDENAVTQTVTYMDPEDTTKQYEIALADLGEYFKQPLFTATDIETFLKDVGNQIYRYDILEVWVFNKRYSSFRSEIIAIKPWFSPDGSTARELGWIAFKDLRRRMVQIPIKLSDMHASTGLGQYSMDAFFSSRLYRGDIIEAENLHGKPILDMTKHSRADILKIREQIEKDLVNLEQDIWEY